MLEYIGKLLQDEVGRLSQESLISRLVKRLGLPSLDDRVTSLQSNPVGMFMYNLRALFFAIGVTCLTLLTIATLTTDYNSEMKNTLIMLWSALIFSILWTLARHRRFQAQLENINLDDDAPKFDLLFRHYFLVDIVILVLMVVIGYLYPAFRSQTLIVFIIVTALVYLSLTSGDSEDSKSLSRLGFVIFALFLGTAAWFLLTVDKQIYENLLWFYWILDWGPVIFGILLTSAIVWMMTYLRGKEVVFARKSFRQIAAFITSLTQVGDDSKPLQGPLASYRVERIRILLSHICSEEGEYYKYHSARLWLSENHEDKGKVLFKYGEYFESPKIRNLRRVPEDLLSTCSNISYPAIENPQSPGETVYILVPLHNESRNRIGVLELRRHHIGNLSREREKLFLETLARIVWSNISQWRNKDLADAQEELDKLFSCDSVESAYEQAADILRRHLDAEGIMILMQDDDDSPKLTIKAKRGLSNRIYENHYKVGEGLTGACVEKAQRKRIDDVSLHVELFGPELLKNLNKALRKECHAWMGIPIRRTGRDTAYGLIKVTNKSKGPVPFFTDFEEDLASNLAIKLQVVLERFLELSRRKAAQIEAENKAKQEASQRTLAEEIARSRQQDLMIMTHQLQGPLKSVNTMLTYLIETKKSLKSIKSELKLAELLIHDALNVTHGTFTAMSSDAGNRLLTREMQINVAEELKALCDRLKYTNGREDLNFVYQEAPNFPLVKMDKYIFTSVVYTLIHNVTKYSYYDTEVILESSFEWNPNNPRNKRGALKVKSIGETILPSERERIFEQFARGSIVKETGRHGAGAGIGLWIARKLMREMEGDLRLELSYKVPDLSVFVIEFPQRSLA